MHVKLKKDDSEFFFLKVTPSKMEAMQNMQQKQVYLCQCLQKINTTKPSRRC